MIENSTSEWPSPVVLVKMKNGQYRFAVDYRRLNLVTKLFWTPLGKLNLQSFQSWTLRQGFGKSHWTKILNAKLHLLFITACFNEISLLIGLMNAPASFQHVMSEVLRGLNWKCVLVYVDDIFIFINTFEELLIHLQQVFDRLSQASTFQVCIWCIYR